MINIKKKQKTMTIIKLNFIKKIGKVSNLRIMKHRSVKIHRKCYEIVLPLRKIVTDHANFCTHRP